MPSRIKSFLRRRAKKAESEVARLELMLEGRDKAIKILNAGFESLCENHDALKQENRKLAHQIETAKTILAINGVKANLEI